MNLYKWYKLEHTLYLHHIPILPDLIKGLIRVIWGGVIPYQAVIGEGTVLGYQALGTVIHKRCVIGKNCRISQNVTLGGTSGFYEVPILGDNVEVGVGANIIGPVCIGNNVTIGAGAVVLNDLPDDCVAVGVPAKIVKYKDENIYNRAEGKKYEKSNASFWNQTRSH